MISPIETEFKGFRFRSRIEARWAVFFEELGYDWKYEHEGYQAGGARYLPDFEITDAKGNVFYAEVKGDPLGIVRDYERLVSVLNDDSPLPRFADSYATHQSGLLLLGDIPREPIGLVFFPVVRNHAGLHKSWFTFGSKRYPIVITSSQADPLPMMCGLIEELWIENNPDAWKVETKIVMASGHYPGVKPAFKAAQSARFEHGEKP